MRMDTLSLINHLLNLLAPALVTASALALMGPMILKKSPASPGWIANTAINFAASILPLGLGLWYFGRDGKMASYAGMLVCCTISQALASRR